MPKILVLSIRVAILIFPFVGYARWPTHLGDLELLRQLSEETGYKGILSQA